MVTRGGSVPSVVQSAVSETSGQECEYPAARLPKLASPLSLVGLLCLMLAEYSEQRLGDPDDAAAGPRLGLVRRGARENSVGTEAWLAPALPATAVRVGRPQSSASHPQSAGGQVDVRPGEPEHFPLP
jgi:hypothetical protein